MRTTVRLPDELLRQAKTVAAETGRSLTAVIEDALRESFQRRQQYQKSKRRVRLPVFKGKRGLRLGVNLDSWADLLDVMDEPDAAPRR